MFIWTGFECLGEPTPYGWPWRSSYFGSVDLEGFRKDVCYMYQSEWTRMPAFHLFPRWNWKSGQTVDVWVYICCEEVELILIGQSLGVKKKSGDDLHFMRRVGLVPGTLRAGAPSGGKEIRVQEQETAGAPTEIMLVPDRAQIAANGEDPSFVTVKVADAEGTIVPDADSLVHLAVEG